MRPPPLVQRTWATIVLTLRIFSRIDAEQRAAAFAYYALFSMIPLVALLLSVGSMFFDAETVHRAITEYIPLGAAEHEMIFRLAADLERKRGGISVLSIAILSWTSLRFFQALVRAVNRAWHTIPIPWWQMPLKNFAMIAVVGSGLGIGILIPAITQGVAKGLATLEHLIAEQFPGVYLAPMIALLDWSRVIVGALVLFYTFTMLYKLAPRRRVTFRQVWLPALVVTLAVQICQVAFVNYLPRFVDYGIYGTIGGLMLLLMWIYLSGLIIIAGGCLSAAMARLARLPDAVTPATRGR